MIFSYASPTWPPPYRLRYSARAKNVQLRVHRVTGLEVIVPNRRKSFNPASLLLEKRAWIEKHWPTIIAATNQPPQPELPQTMVITTTAGTAVAANQTTWQINYLKSLKPAKQPVGTDGKPPAGTASKQLKMMVNEHLKVITFIGNIEFAAVKRRLISWLKVYAYAQLLPRLQALSQLTTLSYNKIAIRSQTTLWGSCNRDKNINLNLKLIFLPPALIDYVLLHELCHTKYLNHGNRFWQLVNKYNPNYKIIERQLRNADGDIPIWLAKDRKRPAVPHNLVAAHF